MVSIALGLAEGKPLVYLHCHCDVSKAEQDKAQNFLERFSFYAGSDVPSFPTYTQIYLRCTRAEANPEFQLKCKLWWKTKWIPDKAIAFHNSDRVLSEISVPEIVSEFQRFQPTCSKSPSSVPSAKTFYDNVFVTDPAQSPPSALQSEELQCELYPFQRRAVGWMLYREGVEISEQGSLRGINGASTQQLQSLSFRPTSDTQGGQTFTSDLLGRVVRSPHHFLASCRRLRGGNLCEEMGLGKTCEILSLVCLHRQSEPPRTGVFDQYTASKVLRSSSTLIITPFAILDQWKREIAKHAPSLKVMHYRGVKHEGLHRDRSLDEMLHVLLDHDIVLASYTDVAADIHYADEQPKRSLRHEKKYSPMRSPLVKIQWWRVCLDEAQMIESGVSNAARVCQRIPRVNAWCVTGTPLRKEVKDLLGLLIFLRLEPFCDNMVWNRMTDKHKDVFFKLFGSITLRHTKKAIREDLQIPPQRRVVIRVPFTAVEEENYSEMFLQMCDECGLEQDGSPSTDEWNPESFYTIDKMRSWLTRLRQTCLHPKIGIKNRKALGRSIGGPLRTIGEVLENMIDQNENAVQNEQKSFLQAKITQGQLLALEKNHGKALQLYLEALEENKTVLSECRRDLSDALSDQKDEETQSHGTKKLEKFDEDDANKDDAEDQEDRLGMLRKRLRSGLETQHICAFFVASGYFQLKSDASSTEENSSQYEGLEKKEMMYYEEARQIRKELMAHIAVKANREMSRLKSIHTRKFTGIPRIEDFPSFGGIESRRIGEQVKDVLDNLDAQADQIEEWRRTLVTSLLSDLVDQESAEIQGEEYEDSTKQQDDQYTYWFALRTAIADRHETLSGQVNQLVKHEVKEALKWATEGKGHSPELLQRMLREGSKYAPQPKTKVSIRALISEVRSLITTVRFSELRHSRATAEAAILDEVLSTLQRISTVQSETVTKLEKEMALFRSTMNARVEFYRQLQVVSDNVKPLEETNDSELVRGEKLLQQLAIEQRHLQKLANLKRKRTFLLHLRESEQSEGCEPRICVICQTPFEKGFLTVCGHQYCKECTQLWWKDSKNCPICRRHLHADDFHEVTYKPLELHAQEEGQEQSSRSGTTNQEQTSARRDSGIYSAIEDVALDQIKAVSLTHSFGTKIDMLARHIIWLRERDPGAKSIIFSQYKEFLDFLGTAFTTLKVGFASSLRRQTVADFRDDPSRECYLLHAKAYSSGLNLTNATHVFLCEPLINTAIELQAIARVHRIGQQRPTTVWMYLITGSVEESIYEVSVQHRLQQMEKTESGPVPSSRDLPAIEEETLDESNSAQLQTAELSSLMEKGQNSGELVPKDDLWRSIFGNPERRSGRGGDADGARETEVVVGRHLRGEAAEQRRYIGS